jgi:hypothetical protein
MAEDTGCCHGHRRCHAEEAATYASLAMLNGRELHVGASQCPIGHTGFAKLNEDYFLL